MTSKKSAATAALAAAQETSANAEAAAVAADDQVEATAHAITVAEAHVVELLGDLNAGHPDATQAALDQARADVEQAHKDHQWSLLQRNAAHAARSRAQDDEARAHRAVTADEYVRAHRDYNARDSREAVLHEHLRATLTELVLIADARMEQHDRLARDVNSWPADERPTVPPGKPIVTYGTRGMGSWSVMAPNADIAESLTTALADAAEQQRADAQAAANN